MAIFRVKYSSMTASYGPGYVEADTEHQAKRRFMGNAFMEGEIGCISATEVTAEEMVRALAAREREAD